MVKSPKELLTLQTLSKKLGIKVSVARELRSRGDLVPDYFVKHFLLFRADRLESLARRLPNLVRQIQL
jgi:tRNA(Met) C34 N-acetyltransferase TmcA